MYDIVIVGAGIAGMTAAIYAARAGKSVLVLESLACGGQIVNAERIENWPGEVEISGAELSQRIYHQVNNLGAKVSYAEVRGVETVDAMGGADGADVAGGASGAGGVDEASGAGGGFLVRTDEGEYRCKALIIATGTEPRKLGPKQTEEAGDRPILYCATCDGALYRGKTVVVVGSGNTAKHEIRHLEGLASKIYNIHHYDPIPEDADAIFVAIGRIPNGELFRGLVEVNEAGYVVAGEDCHTSRAGVFVAGDVRTKLMRQLVTAAGDGAVAADEAMKYLAQL